MMSTGTEGFERGAASAPTRRTWPIWGDVKEARSSTRVLVLGHHAAGVLHRHRNRQRGTILAPELRQGRAGRA